MNYVHRCKTYKKPANFTFAAGKFNTKIGKSNVKNPIMEDIREDIGINTIDEELANFCNIHIYS